MIEAKEKQAILTALGEEKELHVFKGLFMNPMVAQKQQTGEPYYSFDLKTLKQIGSDDEYGQSYNMYNCIIPSEISSQFSNESIKALKDCEVIVIATAKGSVRKVGNSKFNNISLFVQHLELSRKVSMRPGSVGEKPKAQAI